MENLQSLVEKTQTELVYEEESPKRNFFFFSLFFFLNTPKKKKRKKIFCSKCFETKKIFSIFSFHLKRNPFFVFCIILL
jgi:hypothetical protein